MVKNYSNYEQFGIHDDVEKFVYGVWLMLVVVCSFVGDIIILVASIKYNAIRLHRTVVVYIQHIAVCDLLNAAGNLFPAVISIICNNGGSSKILKFVRFFVNYWVFTACPALISAMTLGKLLLMRYLMPDLGPKRRHTSCVQIFGYSRLAFQHCTFL